MSTHARIHLARLRDIGCRCWDPIGLSGSGSWEDSPAGGQYDDDLLKVARMIRHNEGDDAAVQYLVWAESQHLGVGMRADARSRAQATVAAIRGDDQLWMDD